MVNENKDKIQRQALAVIEKDKYHRAFLFMATGTGKSRVPLLYMQKYDLDDICLVVPTTKLKNEDWPAEYKKWGCEKYLKRTTRVCMKSLHKIKGKTFRLLVVDEAHNLTWKFLEFLKNNTIGACIFMTATKPKKGEKNELFNRLGIQSEFVVTLQEAKKLGLVAPYNIKVISVPLDNEEKYIPLGKHFITEVQKYDGICKAYDNAYKYSNHKQMKYWVNQRMHFLYNLRSKARYTKMLSEGLPKDEKVLIFTGSQLIADNVCADSYHSGLPKEKAKLNIEKFEAGVIKRLSAVRSLNEGANISQIDSAIINQINAQEKDFVQRLGRILRLRDGHIGEMYVFVAKGTQDESWAEDALSSFGKEEIQQYDFSEIFKV